MSALRAPRVVTGRPEQFDSGSGGLAHALLIGSLTLERKVIAFSPSTRDTPQSAAKAVSSRHRLIERQNAGSKGCGAPDAGPHPSPATSYTILSPSDPPMRKWPGASAVTAARSRADVKSMVIALALCDHAGYSSVFLCQSRLNDTSAGDVWAMAWLVSMLTLTALKL